MTKLRTSVDESSYLGSKFGNWTVIATGFQAGHKKAPKHRAFLARCACGQYGRINKLTLTNGKSTSCRSCRPRAGRDNPMWAGYKDIPQQVYTIMCAAAKVRGIGVSITIEDLQAQWERQSGRCALTGIALELVATKHRRTASVDRIDNGLGYTKDNIQWVHKDVNLMKNKFDEGYFLEMCKKVVGHRSV